MRTCNMRTSSFPYIAIALICVLFVSPVSSSISSAKSSSKEVKITLDSYPTIIACKNTKTGEILDPKNKSVEDGGCLIGRNMKNMLLPSESQMKLLKEVYGDRASIITAITLMNHESQFNKKAKGCHKFGCDIGLFQIRDIYGGAKMSEKEQMEWFRDRKASQLKKGGNCSHRIKQGQEATLRCVFARHRGDLSGQAAYPTARYSDWKFYNEYFQGKTF